MNYDFSFIIPVYNRPFEIDELLSSFLNVNGILNSEIIIVEDGSQQTCETVISKYKALLNISYYFKKNSGPGNSRNYGMEKAKSDYFIILDSDVLLPGNYLDNLYTNLKHDYVDCFGGPDNAHESFTDIQKAINYSMTSFWTTGGIRGGRNAKKNFQPRSFNMGISRLAFQKSGGFGNIHPGEDPDLSLRLQKLNFKTTLYENCYVYHKRRINWKKFNSQIRKFGLVRPILNLWHPDSHRLVFYFPSLFSFGLLFSVVLSFVGFYWLLFIYVLYYVILSMDAWLSCKSFKIALYALIAVNIQFFSYGLAFFESTFNITILKNRPEKVYPELFN
jgi:glycosyltransferase involved in cell wall biosynthesis